MAEFNEPDQTDTVDLLQAFASFDRFRTMVNTLLTALESANSASATVLALEGLFRIEDGVQSQQFSLDPSLRLRIRKVLRQWRCNSNLEFAYVIVGKRVPDILRNLTIFATFKIPLFVDDYGQKKLMNIFNDEQLVNIDIDLQTPIVHVTHCSEKENILKARKFVPSDNKNIIAGTWFSPENQLGWPPRSVYGSWAFETTLEKLGVECIRQGEIVSYKDEVNFILYAGRRDEDEFAVLCPRKATDEAAKEIQGRVTAYTAVSIFVPSEFLPNPLTFDNAITGPFKVHHIPFCVRAFRNFTSCQELDA
ncbi:uncharacterized protein LOC114536545 [Dendronephthya gigantea]|uniref:uncharacterized protein LOC114536545 n=1 Tax=Dendronephthya gigantea TaxID=151771 RepID=UPI00106A41EF|nr:uncharacterized protein LOC114536545 [Dendronephthya gigantea]